MIRSAKWLLDRWNDVRPYARLPSPFPSPWPFMASLLLTVSSPWAVLPTGFPEFPRFRPRHGVIRPDGGNRP
ncbi:hypothetical protein SSP24_02510 [Streptomyces spinoverrucosus]|uniref:Uncharacterized protein n=1 Tax=Streptomyces spinoverrucosus TaxID=284043 RepID=A0A4Y3VC76_9ACTN|nr:hypothetical protein SSP24_02510 [Streptomyces spinoverrucosus]